MELLPRASVIGISSDIEIIIGLKNPFASCRTVSDLVFPRSAFLKGLSHEIIMLGSDINQKTFARTCYWNLYAVACLRTSKGHEKFKGVSKIINIWNNMS
jgi:hypothetical protein